MVQIQFLQQSHQQVAVEVDMVMVLPKLAQVGQAAEVLAVVQVLPVMEILHQFHHHKVVMVAADQLVLLVMDEAAEAALVHVVLLEVQQVEDTEVMADQIQLQVQP